MKEQITIYYDKDKKHPNDYIIKRVLTPEGNKYSVVSYYKIFGVVKRHNSEIKLSDVYVNKYILQCMKSQFFNRIEYQKVMEGFKND